MNNENLELTFFDVGQGDAILLKWNYQGVSKFGVIDCNEFKGSNELVESIRAHDITQIEFVILSHLHLDHFAGLPDLFRYCIENDIKILKFYSTIDSIVLHVYDKIYRSKRLDSILSQFMELMEQVKIEELIPASCHIEDLKLSEDIELSFLAPDGKAYRDIARQVHNKTHGISTTREDINRLATIIQIRCGSKCIILTSDAVKKSFQKNRNRVSSTVKLVQIPHHGSINNLDKEFWKNLKKEDGCPAIVSIGDVKRDKLPNLETIEFFDKQGFKVYSTNQVYGIAEYFNVEANPQHDHKVTLLNLFSSKRWEDNESKSATSRFRGTQVFQCFTD